MNRRTKVPSIPDPTPDGLVDLARSVKSLLDVREGRNGDKQDRFVSFRDLEDMRLITDAKSKSENPAGNDDGNPGGDDGYDPTRDFTVPPIPTGFKANGGYGIIMLDWDTPQSLYRNHGYTEIWRNTVDVIGNAVMVGTTIAAVYTDPVPDATTYYYWIRFVSEANITGPYNSTSGTSATSAINVPRVLEALSGQITSSQLYGDLRSRIDLIDADPTIEGSVAWRVAQQAESTDAAITEVRQIITDANQSLAQQTSIMTARFNDAYGAIATEATARATEDGVLAGQISSVSSTANSKNTVFFQTSAPTAIRAGDLWFDSDDNNAMYRWSGSAWVREAVAATVYRQTSAPTSTSANPLRVGDMWFDSDDQNRPYRWDGSQWVDVRDGFIGTVDARVTTVENTKIGYCTIGGVASDQTTKSTCEAAGGVWNVGLPIATAVKQVSVTAANGTSATVQQQFEAVYGANGLRSQYTVKIDNNGAVSGFGLASTAVDGVPTSEFYVNANRFAITAPSNGTGTALPGSGPYNGYTFYRTGDKTHWLWNGSAWVSFNPIVPFTVQTTPTTVNGVSVPAGVYIDAAYIKDGTITSAKIGNAVITEAKIASLAVTDAKIANGAVTNLKIGNEIYSDNWVTSFNSDGWYIRKDGVAIFKSITARGSIIATSGSFGEGNQRININADNIASNNFSAGSAGFRIGYDGNAEFNQVTVRGAVYASSGTFSGSLSAATGTFSGSLSAATGTFSGTLTASAIDAVNTINIAGNAVTIPQYTSQSGSVYNGNWVESGYEQWDNYGQDHIYVGTWDPANIQYDAEWSSQSTTYWKDVMSFTVNYGAVVNSPDSIIGFTQRATVPSSGRWGIRWRVVRTTPSFTVVGYGSLSIFDNSPSTVSFNGVVFDSDAPNGSNTYKLQVMMFGDINDGNYFVGGKFFALGAKR